MSNLCIGTAQFGMNYGIANSNGQVNAEEIVSILDYCNRKNIEYIDTAQAYGNSEERIGQAIKKLKIEGNFKIITKFSPDTNSFNTLQSINKSLKNLQMNSVWGILLHRFDTNNNYNDFYEQIKKHKAKNIIENFGVSVYNPKDAILAANEPSIDIIQIPFNILDKRFIENNFFELSKKNNKKIFLRSIYLQGLLLMNESDLKKKNMDWAIPYLKILWDYISFYNLDIKSFALNGVKHITNESIIITGIDSSIQLEENYKLNKEFIESEIISNWWKNLPDFPDRLLNPSLW